MKVRYVIAGFSEQEAASSPPFVSISGLSKMNPGWYRLKFDDQCRMAFEAGPFDTAEDALRPTTSSTERA